MSDAAQTNRFDSGRHQLGTVYAKALLGAAQNAGKAEAVLAELDSLVVDVLDKKPKFDGIFSSPRVAVADKERMIENAFSSRASKVLVTALKVMARHGRLDCLREVRTAYRRLYNEATGRVEVSLRTAAPISNQMMEQIRNRLREVLKREVEITHSVDDSLLGGMVVRVGDTLFDASLVSKLERMRETALEKTEEKLRSTFDKFVGA